MTMLQITPPMRILVRVQPVDVRNGIDGLARIRQTALGEDPFQGTLFTFRNRRGGSLKILAYDGQGFRLCQKRLSVGRFTWWPAPGNEAAKRLAAHELQVLLSAGDSSATKAAPLWRSVAPPTAK